MVVSRSSVNNTKSEPRKKLSVNLLLLLHLLLRGCRSWLWLRSLCEFLNFREMTWRFLETVSFLIGRLYSYIYIFLVVSKLDLGVSRVLTIDACRTKVSVLLELHWWAICGWWFCDVQQQEPIGSLSSFLAQQRHNSCRREKERCVESRASWEKFTDSFVLWRITSIQCWTKRSVART